MEPQGVSDGSQVLRFPLQHERGGPERKKRKVREGEYSKERGRERERKREDRDEDQTNKKNKALRK